MFLQYVGDWKGTVNSDLKKHPYASKLMDILKLIHLNSTEDTVS